MKRLDLLLLERGLVSTRTKAQDLIARGCVSVNGREIRKAGEKFPEDASLSLSEEEHPYVSRGGLKLEAALREFHIDVKGLRAIDVGQSTGGFTQCLLERGVASVLGVDVGTGQLADSLRVDPRVTFLEKQDIRELAPPAPGFEFFVVDLSFISLTKVIPALGGFLADSSEGVVLVKPQFEVGREALGSGGIVRDAAARDRALAGVKHCCREHGFTVAGELASPVAGGDGNVEFLLHLRRLSPPKAI